MTTPRSSLPLFFLLTFLVTWTSRILAWPPSGGLRTVVFYVGIFPPGIVAMVFLGQAGEELGWRGYALPRCMAHAAFNNFKDIVPSGAPGATNPWALSSSLAGWLSVAVRWVCAGYPPRHMPTQQPSS